VLRQFVLLRVLDMRGVDLTRFDFDYDLTWAGFFLNHRGHIYGRYGGRDEGPADKGLSLDGLRYAMQMALNAHRRNPNQPPHPVEKATKKVEQFPAAKRVKQGACIHCHQVYDFRREQLMVQKRWSRKEIFVYPPPENIGLFMAVEQGDRVQRVGRSSPAAAAGLRPGDVLQTANGHPVASYGDLQYALQGTAATGPLKLVWRRGSQEMSSDVPLKAGWRESDISWRGSMWGIEPRIGVYGKDLTAKEKRALGLSADRLAFRQGKFVPNQSRRAGIRGADIIVGINDRPLRMNMLQFNAYVRLNFKVGDSIVFNIVRNGRKRRLPMKLTSQIHK
jgi:predicted metalloprotease with PDZ domain